MKKIFSPQYFDGDKSSDIPELKQNAKVILLVTEAHAYLPESFWRQTPKSTRLNVHLDNMSHVTFHLSHVMCHMLHIMYHISTKKNRTKGWSYSVEGLLLTGPNPSSLLINALRIFIARYARMTCYIPLQNFRVFVFDKNEARSWTLL